MCRFFHRLLLHPSLAVTFSSGAALSILVPININHRRSPRVATHSLESIDVQDDDENDREIDSGNAAGLVLSDNAPLRRTYCTASTLVSGLCHGDSERDGSTLERAGAPDS